MKDLWEYGKKHGRLILLSLAATLICFGLLVFSGNLRIDTEELINHPGTTLGWTTIGRFGLAFLKQLLGLTTHQAVLSGVLFMVFFVIGANLLMFAIFHFSGKKENYPYWIFLLLYTTSNIWSFQIYFSVQQAEIALAMLLVVIAAILAVRCAFEADGWLGNSFRTLVATALLVLGLGAYQALASYYIAICIMLFMAYLGNPECFREGRLPQEVREKNSRLLAGIVFLIGQFGVSYVIYKVIADTWFMATGSYMENQMGWGKYPAVDCIKNVLRTAKNLLVGWGPRNFSFFTVGALLLVILLVLVWTQKRYQSKFRFLMLLIGSVGLLAAPFLMTMYMGEMLVTRSQFALPVVAAFLGMYGIGMLQAGWENYFGVRKLLTACVLVTVVLQTAYNLQMTYTDYVRYEEDKDRAVVLLDELTKANGGEMPEVPVVFVGYQKAELDELCGRTEMYGWSFYEWDYDVENPTGTTHRICGFLKAENGVELNEDATDEMRKMAVELSADMPVFPLEGSVQATEEFVVVKLSEIAERTDLNWW